MKKTIAPGLPAQLNPNTSCNWTFNGWEKAALVAGTIAAVSAIALLLEVPVRTGKFTLEHALTPILVLLTIYFGKLMVAAAKDRALPSMVGSFFVFLLGLSLTFINSAGNQAVRNEALTANARAVNAKIARLKVERTRYERRYDDARHEFRDQMNGNKRRNINKCRHTEPAAMAKRCPVAYGWKLAMAEREAKIADINLQIDSLGAVRTLNPKAAFWGQVAKEFGGNAETVERIIGLIVPFLWTALLEAASIVAFGFALRAPLKAMKRTARTCHRQRPETKGDGEYTDARALADLIDPHEQGGQPEQADLQKRWDWSASRVSRFVTRQARTGRFVKERKGRNVVLAMVA